MKLVKIHEELLNEAAKGPLAAFEYIFKAAGKGLAEANGALLKSVQKINPNVKQLFRATPEEVNKAFKRLEFKEYRKIIVDHTLTNQKKEIEKILKKFDLSNTESVKLAKAEVANKLSLKDAVAYDVVERYRPKKVKSTSTKTTPPPTPPNVPDINAFEKFLDGLRLSGYDYLINNYGRLAKTFKEKYYQNLGNINTLQQEFNSLATNVLIKVDPKNPKIVDNELTKMANVLAKVGYQKELNLKTIWDSWKAEMPVEFAKNLKTWENPKFQQLVNYFEKLDPTKIKSAPIATYSKMEGFLNFFKKKERVLDKVQRMIFTITHLDPRTAAEINNSIKIYGLWRALGKGVGQKLILGFVVFPFYYSFLKTLLDYLDLHTGLSLYLGNKEDIVASGELNQNVGDNVIDALSTFRDNFFRAYPIVVNDYKSLLAWSPALWFLNKDRYSKMSKEELHTELKNTVPKINDESERLKKEVTDTVKSEPSMIDKIKNEWNELTKSEDKPKEKLDMNF